jgi:hypothetical protein
LIWVSSKICYSGIIIKFYKDVLLELFVFKRPYGALKFQVTLTFCYLLLLFAEFPRGVFVTQHLAIITHHSVVENRAAMRTRRENGRLVRHDIDI